MFRGLNLNGDLTQGSLCQISPLINMSSATSKLSERPDTPLPLRFTRCFLPYSERKLREVGSKCEWRKVGAVYRDEVVLRWDRDGSAVVEVVIERKLQQLPSLLIIPGSPNSFLDGKAKKNPWRHLQFRLSLPLLSPLSAGSFTRRGFFPCCSHVRTNLITRISALYSPQTFSPSALYGSGLYLFVPEYIH